MSKSLIIGDKFMALPSKSVGTIEQQLSSGAQATVYNVSIDSRRMALKAYHPICATSYQLSLLETLISMPAPSNAFIWPHQLAFSANGEFIGYIMRLLEPEMISIQEIGFTPLPLNYAVLCEASENIANAFLALHANGLCYRDISDMNIYFHPYTGKVSIIDNDNITFDKDPETAVLGTMNFMAPEIVTGRAMPSTNTDLFSIASILFRINVFSDALLGQKALQIGMLDEHDYIELLGSNPVFVFDPNDNSNRPVPGYHDNALQFWPKLPLLIQQLFIKSFTDGLHDPQHGRVLEQEWISAFRRMKDSIFLCECGTEHFYDIEQAPHYKDKSKICEKCGQALQFPPRLRINNRIITLAEGSALVHRHFNSSINHSAANPIGRVTSHPNHPYTLGLQNLTTDTWVCTIPNGSIVPLPPNKTIKLIKNMKINFGPVEGTVRL